jgi:hypothetical protein
VQVLYGLLRTDKRKSHPALITGWPVFVQVND